MTSSMRLNLFSFPWNLALGALGAIATGCAPGDLDVVSGPFGTEMGDPSLLPEDALPPRGARLSTTAPIIGETMYLHVGNHAPFANVRVVRGRDGSRCPPALGGDCVDIEIPRVVASGVTDGGGQALLSRWLPWTIPSGRTTQFQSANAVGAGFTMVSEPRTMITEDSSPCAFGSMALVHNPFAELPLHGEYLGGPVVQTSQSYSGAWALEIDGNVNIRQEIVPTPVSMLAEARFATWHDPMDGAIQWIGFIYADGSTGGFLVFNTADPSGWEVIDLLPHLDSTKTLVSFELWGYSNGAAIPDITRFDDFAFCTYNMLP